MDRVIVFAIYLGRFMLSGGGKGARGILQEPPFKIRN